MNFPKFLKLLVSATASSLKLGLPIGGKLKDSQWKFTEV